MSGTVLVISGERDVVVLVREESKDAHVWLKRLIIGKHEKISSKRLTYSPVGLTVPSADTWVRPVGFRVFEKTVSLGCGDDVWNQACHDLMKWAVKKRGGFGVASEFGDSNQVTDGSDFWLFASFGFVTVREPIRVVSVVDTPVRCGYAYGTLEGHPVSGEEAFILHRLADEVRFTVRSMTRPGVGAWRFLFPMVLLAQKAYRHRYFVALRMDAPKR